MNSLRCEECGVQLIPELTCCPHCATPANLPLPSEVRCECGFLLCKLDLDSIEIKCRRCKRLVRIPVMAVEKKFRNNKKKMGERCGGPRSTPSEKKPRGQYCTACGQYKPNVLYGKCLECRTETIKVQYRGRPR